MATAGTHNYCIFMERGLPPVQSITRRWLRGSLLITICILAAALGLFLYYSHQNLYGGVQRAMQARFSTVEGRLQATGTAGSSQATSESRSQSLRRTVEQFDEKDKFEFMLLDSSGVVLATSSVRERAVEVLTRLGVVQYFDDMVFGTEIERGKPWPDIFLKAAEKAHAAPADCLVLEDSEAGIQAAHAAGIDVLCVPDMKMPAESYQQMTAAMLKSLDEVKGWLTAE